MIGWYSDEAAVKFGYAVYLNSHGQEVCCTLVSPGNDHKSQWEDIRCMGEVVEFIRRVPGEWDYLEEPLDYDDWN